MNRYFCQTIEGQFVNYEYSCHDIWYSDKFFRATYHTSTLEELSEWIGTIEHVDTSTWKINMFTITIFGEA